MRLLAAALLAAALAVPVAAQQDFDIAKASTHDEAQDVMEFYRILRSSLANRMAEAQRACDRETWEDLHVHQIIEFNRQLDLIRTRIEILDTTPQMLTQDEFNVRFVLVSNEMRLASSLQYIKQEKYVPCADEVKKEFEVAYQDACQDLGKGFFYVPGTDICLRYPDDGGPIEAGEVRSYSGTLRAERGRGDFEWGEPQQQDQPADEEQQEEEQLIIEDEPVLRGPQPVGGGLSGSGALINVPTGQSFGVPAVAIETYTTDTGTIRRGAFSTETATLPQTPIVPGYEFDTNYRGYGVTGTLSTELSFGGFSKVLLGATLGVDYTKAEVSDTNVQFLQGFGIPGVDPTPGVFINSPTDMLTFDYWSEKRQSRFGFDGGLPLMGGVTSMFGGQPVEYSIDGLVGFRTGMFTQTERMLATLDTPAFGPNSGSTVEYNTKFDGMYYGALGGIGLRAETPLGDSGLFLQKEASLKAGVNFYRLGIDDTLEADVLNGTVVLDRSNSFDVSKTVPFVGLETSIGIGNDKFTAAIMGGLSYGETANIDYQRLDDGNNPTVDVVPATAWKAGIRVQARF
jgi:hypothetical protein